MAPDVNSRNGNRKRGSLGRTRERVVAMYHTADIKQKSDADLVTFISKNAVFNTDISILMIQTPSNQQLHTASCY